MLSVYEKNEVSCSAYFSAEKSSQLIIENYLESLIQIHQDE